jgi:hypothetical protein
VAGNGARLFDVLRRTNEARTIVDSVFQDGLGYLDQSYRTHLQNLHFHEKKRGSDVSCSLQSRLGLREIWRDVRLGLWMYMGSDKGYSGRAKQQHMCIGSGLEPHTKLKISSEDFEE